jgi:hypothetical protein
MDAAQDDPYFSIAAHRSSALPYDVDLIPVGGFGAGPPLTVAHSMGRGEVAIGMAAHGYRSDPAGGGVVAWIDNPGDSVSAAAFSMTLDPTETRGGVPAAVGAPFVIDSRAEVDPDENLWDLRVTPVPGGSVLASWRAQVARVRLDAATIGWDVEEPRWAFIPEGGEPAEVRHRIGPEGRLPADAIAFDPDDSSTRSPQGLAFSIERKANEDGSHGPVGYALYRGFVGPDLRSTGSFTPTPIRTRGQVQPAAVAGADAVLVVWREGFRVLARLIGTDDARPVVVVRGSRGEDGCRVTSACTEFHGQPAVVATRDGFLVAWQDGFKTLEWAWLDHLARVVDGDRLTLSADTVGSRNFSVSLASPGTEQLAIIRGDSRVMGIRFADGAASAPFTIATDEACHPYGETRFPPESVAVATDGGRSVVAWEALVVGFRPHGTIRAAFIEGSEVVGGPFNVPTAPAGGSAIRPVAAHIDGRFLVAWRHQEAHGNVDHWTVRGRLLDGELLAPLAGEIELIDPPHDTDCDWGICATGVHTLSLAEDGSSLVLVGGGGTDEPVRVVRLDRDAVPIPWNPQRLDRDGSDASWSLLDDAPRVSDRAGLTAVAPLAQGRFLVLYEELDPTTEVSWIAARVVDFEAGLR